MLVPHQTIWPTLRPWLVRAGKMKSNSYKENGAAGRRSRLSKDMISPPKNFKHLGHIGLDSGRDGMQAFVRAYSS